MIRVRFLHVAIGVLLIMGFCSGQLRAADFLAVENKDQADIVYKDAVSMLQSKLGMTFKYPVEMQLVTGKELDELAKGSPYRGAVTGMHMFRNGKHMIYMLTNTGKDDFFGTICHEMTHGWQMENCPAQETTLKEGLAVWVEYKCLCWSGAYALANRLNQNIADPVYGVGYRYVQKLEDKVGEKNVLAQIKTLQRVPDNER